MINTSQMRNIAAKIDTLRTAVAQTAVQMEPSTVQLLRENRAPKGDPLPLARVAAIMGAKKTSDLIPYCHPLLIDAVIVDFELKHDTVDITVTVTAVAKTGVEMEALTAASLAALTIYDMLKPIDKSMEILGCRLVKKTGGKSSFPTASPEGLRAAVVVTSDSLSSGAGTDRSGELIRKSLQEWGVQDVTLEVVPDEQAQIAEKLTRLCDSGIRLVITTGGTGLGPRDYTDAATRQVIERDAPGIAEAMRAYGQKRTPVSMLSCGAAGLRGRSLIINMPGSPGGVADSIAAIFPAIFHSFAIIDGGGH